MRFRENRLIDLKTLPAWTACWLLALSAVSAAQTRAAVQSDMHSGHEGGAAVLLKNGKVFIAAGDSGEDNVIDLYDPAENSFAASLPLTMADSRGRSTMTLLPNGKVLIAGGWGKTGALATTELFNPVYNCFAGHTGCPDQTAPPVMNVARTEAAATLLPDGRVLIAGGDSGDPTKKSFTSGLRSTELYDSATNTFAPSNATPLMNTGRAQAIAVLLGDGKVLIAGGNVNGRGLNTSELYDPQSNTFAAPDLTPEMRARRDEVTATLLRDGRVLIAGGNLDSIEIYDPVKNCFAGAVHCPGAPAPPRMSVARTHAVSALLPDGRVLIAGGGGYQDVSATTDLYDPATNTFTPADSTPTMNYARTEAIALPLPNGLVLIAGGEDSADRAVLHTELYDPARACFAGQQCGSHDLPPVMNTVHRALDAVSLPNGKVLVVGGAGETNFESTSGAELYDPAANSFARPSAVPMIDGSPGATLTLLPNGRVLVAGGYGERRAVNITRLYDSLRNCFSSFACPDLQDPPRLLHPRSDANATLLHNGMVLIAGGETGEETLDSAELYDPAHNCLAGAPGCPEQTPPGNLVTGRSSAAAVLLPQGKVLLVGGNHGITNVLGAGKQLRTMELYDPAYHCFAGHTGCPDKTVLPLLDVPRAGATATLLPNGNVLIAGGYNAEDGGLASTELYDAAHNCMAGRPGCPGTKPPAMNAPRADATATLLRNGEVLIAGGVGPAAAASGRAAGPEALGSVELFDPATNRFLPPPSTPHMNTARKYASAVMLENGKVLIVGGQSIDDRELTSTEWYDPARNCFAGPVCSNRPQ